MSDRESRRAAGLTVREQVVGKERVRSSFKGAPEIARPLQELATDFAWGEIWTRDGLSRRDRSIITIGMLIALNKPEELKVHLRGGINNGLSSDELREIVIHSAIYAGFPAALSAMQILISVVEG